MKFDKNHKVILKSLTKEEAIVFKDKFLNGEETMRHRRAMWDAERGIRETQIIAEVYKNAIVRHDEDLDSIEETIRQLKELFKI